MLMKATATPQGLILNGPLWKATLPWERVAEVISDDTSGLTGLIQVRTPVLLLTDGRRFRLVQAGFYDPGHHNHQAAGPARRIAAELEALRLTHCPRPSPPRTDHTGSAHPGSQHNA
jgi:hypothetical protein